MLLFLALTGNPGIDGSSHGSLPPVTETGKPVAVVGQSNHPPRSERPSRVDATAYAEGVLADDAFLKHRTSSSALAATAGRLPARALVPDPPLLEEAEFQVVPTLPGFDRAVQ